MKKPAIKVDNITLTYKYIAARSIKQTLLSFKKVSVKKKQALKGISFSLEAGEILGIVGGNGSGKSTLLSAIAGIISPDSGSIDVFGNKVSLLALGVGYNGDVSGRENIYLNGLLLGFSKKQIKEKISDIIEFSELGSAIDTPVKTYSSGMKSKLSFSITSILKTDIMLVDEVLSVGDPSFRKKSFAKMKELITDKNTTAIIVSHQESTLNDLCTKILWLKDGKIHKYGPTSEVLPKYIESIKGTK